MFHTLCNLCTDYVPFAQLPITQLMRYLLRIADETCIYRYAGWVTNLQKQIGCDWGGGGVIVTAFVLLSVWVWVCVWGVCGCVCTN